MDRYSILKNKELKNILKSVVNLICYDDNINFRFEGDISYNDGKTITVGVPNITSIEKKDIEEITILEKGLTGHECQHKRSSNWDVLKEGIDEMEQYFINKYNLYSGGYIFKEIFNAIEDGRIEIILSYNYLGFVSYLHYLNITFWEDTDFLYEKLDDFRAFTLAICYLATLGIYPKNYVKRYKKTELNKNLQKIKKYIRKGITAYSCKDCAEICKKIIFVIEPFLIQFLTEKPDDSKNDYNEFTSSSECDFNEEYKNDSSEQNEENSNNNESNNGNENNEQQNEKKKSFEGSKNEINNDNNLSNNNDNTSKEDNNSKSKTSFINGNNGLSDENNLDSNDTNNSDNVKSPNHIGNDIDDSSTGDNEDIDSKNEELVISKKRLSVKNVIKQITKELKIKSDDEEVNFINNRLDIKDVCSKYSDGINYEEIKIYQGTNNKPSTEILVKGRKLERELEYILKNKSIPNRKTYKGLINVNELWQVKLLEPKMFIKKGREEKADYVCEILLDSSGSMNNYNKAQYALKTISIIEEGLRKIIPLKMIGFSAYGTIKHMVIKDFNDTKNINYTENSNISFNSGNKDGFSIRLATKDLMLRPESKKILIIMSDGLPSDYPSDKCAKEDVMDAVFNAKRKGIVIVPIFFGSERERTRLYPEYKEMYKENIISCNPKDIEKYLLIMLRRIISKH